MNQSENQKKQPNFLYEKRLWRKGFKYVAGVDEVGRGCFAGPVVAGCVVFAPISNYSLGLSPGRRQFPIISEKGEEIIIDDSKNMRPRKREKAAKWIKDNAKTWGTGEVSARVINRIGMTKATQMAFRRAVDNASHRLGKRADYLLIDHFFAPYVRGLPMARKKARRNRKLSDGRARQKAIVNGDEKSISIAAASIIAKVYRDKEMAGLSRKPRYKKYGWGRNKGYGTREHREVIIKFGMTRYHRRIFVETFRKNIRTPVH